MLTGWRLWARTRGWLALAIVHVLACMALLMTSGQFLPVTTLLGVGMQVPHAAVIPALVAIIFAHGLSRRDLAIECQAVRRVSLADVAVAIALVGMVVVLGQAFDSLWITWVGARNLAGLIGMALALVSLGLREGAAIVVVVFVILCFLAGSDVAHVAVWSWLLKSASDVTASLIAAGLLGLGSIMWLRH